MTIRKVTLLPYEFEFDEDKVQSVSRKGELDLDVPYCGVLVLALNRIADLEGTRAHTTLTEAEWDVLKTARELGELFKPVFESPNAERRPSGLLVEAKTIDVMAVCIALATDHPRDVAEALLREALEAGEEALEAGEQASKQS
jgi:hypothetical protein